MLHLKVLIKIMLERILIFILKNLICHFDFVLPD